MADEIKVTSTVSETTNLNGAVEIETNGMKQQIMNMNCSLVENGVANIQTYVIDMNLFKANSALVAAEVQKFRTKANEVAKGLNCFVF
ncbi:hypothetical protein K5V21_13735 [Clostridium sardiniense]|uniref:Uncharacterized protein n=1 Tax=Clostridium sardiniense TaxID=29369 RepID=A0ABS7L0T0_CLOSR|nr:hypothetical protein [Clostridium sardiniense]MBY0756507.1 hypothetical protein [Clostridium sardiniense]MDQ0460253.1 hypothetical protein [Clostridium sardiniense]